MEETLMSSPLGHSDWDSEQPLPQGFLLMDSDKGPVLPQKENVQTGLDFQKDIQDVVPLSLEEIFQENALNLDSIFRTSSYSGEQIVQREADQPNRFQDDRQTTTPELTPLPEKSKGQELSSNDPLSEPCLFNTTGCEELDPPQEHPSLPNVSDRTSDENNTKTTTPLLVDIFSSEHSPSSSPGPAALGGVNSQGVSEEVLLLTLDEDRGLPLSRRGGECVSPETGDKGLFQEEPVTDPLAIGNASPEGSPAGHLSSDIIPTGCHSEPPPALERSAALLDSEVPECDGSLSLCPTNLASLTCSRGGPSDSPAEDPEQRLTLATPISTVSSSQHRGAGDSSSSPPNDALSTEPSPEPRLLSAEDALGDSPRGGCSPEENASQALMEDDTFLFDVRRGEDEEMALDHCLTTEELHSEAAWGFTPPEGVQDENVSASQQTQQSDGERPQSADLSEPSDRHDNDTFDFPGQLNGSFAEQGWISTPTLEETLSLSKMVVSDSMAVVPVIHQKEEDLSPLKAVFDALDQDGDGFVRIEEFLEFAAAYGADQVKDLTKFLDPSGLGVISFEDFHRGISAISNGGTEPQLYEMHFSQGDEAGVCQEEYDEQNEVTDSAYLGSESTYSECETFTDEDTGALVAPEMHEEVETDSGIDAALHEPEDGSNRFSMNSDLHSPAPGTVIGGEEEHFEDFGESNTSELLLLETTDDGTECEGDSSLLQASDQARCSPLLLSPSGPALPSSLQSFLREEAQDFYCSQCHKQISRLEDLSTRLNFLEMNSSGKRLSSRKAARHLLQNSSTTLDSMGELSRDILELADTDITDKVLLLERRVAELEQDSEASGEQHARLRQENLQLVHRANALEEQLKEQELRSEEQLHREARRHKDALAKLERERGLELENLQARFQQLDEENSELRSCVPCLRANIERQEEEKRKLQDETEDVTDRLNQELEARRKMADKLSHERHQNQKEKECTQELIEDLRKQLEHLQLYKLEAEARRGRSSSAGLQEYQSRTREAELEQEVRRLKQDNRSLKEQNDELNGQIINLSIQGAKNLVTASFSESLAAEINSVSRGELMEAIHKQEEINYRLQDYIDRIIVAIMESNPSMLEVK